MWRGTMCLAALSCMICLSNETWSDHVIMSKSLSVAWGVKLHSGFQFQSLPHGIYCGMLCRAQIWPSLLSVEFFFFFFFHLFLQECKACSWILTSCQSHSVSWGWSWYLCQFVTVLQCKPVFESEPGTIVKEYLLFKVSYVLSVNQVHSCTPVFFTRFLSLFLKIWLYTSFSIQYIFLAFIVCWRNMFRLAKTILVDCA